MRILLIIALLLPVFVSSARAADSDFNEFMLRAYRMLLRDRANKGYDLHSYFTRDLNYGNQSKVIKAKHEPLTMCNAAVTETMIEAINIYANDNRSWSPQASIPYESWEKFGFTNLKSHLFSHNMMDYPPLENIPAREIPQSLKTDIQKFHSEKGMAFAVEKFGIGQKIDFKSAKPGDFATFDRTNDTRSGAQKYSGHSVVFLGFVNRNQELVESYNDRTVVGFKYFSSQGTGMGERWAYFKGFCPVRAGYDLPENPAQAGCKDRIDNAQNRAANGMEKPGQITDCCLNKITASDGPRVGRLFSPARWTYTASQPRIAQDYTALKTRIDEFVRNRANASVRLNLIARGAVALEAQNPRVATPYIERVNQRFGVNLRSIATDATAPSIAPTNLGKIVRTTPRSVINAANRQVTVPVKEAFEEKIRNAVSSASERLSSTEAIGVPNRRLDSPNI